MRLSGAGNASIRLRNARIRLRECTYPASEMHLSGAGNAGTAPEMRIRRRKRWNRQSGAGNGDGGIGTAIPAPEPRSIADPAPEIAPFRIARDGEIPNGGAL